MQLSKRYQQIIEQVHNDIASNPTTIPYIRAIAQRYGIPRTTLNYYFKQQYGITIYQYRLQIAMNYARGKILSGEKIKNLQQQLGYETSGSFARAYKKIHAETPSDTLEAQEKGHISMMKKFLYFWFPTFPRIFQSLA
jgi:AraC-like DNA-binding protein